MTGTVTIYQNDFDSTYHSLQATLVKRWANSMQYQLAYTFSHNIDNLDVSSLPIFSLHARGNSDFDIRQQFRGAFGYELPFGHGKALMSGAGRIANAIAGGWQVNGVLSLYTGFPFSVAASANTLNIGEGTRADRLSNGSLPGDQRTLQRWFDLSAFANPGFRFWGNGGRNILTGLGAGQLDLSLFKSFTIQENRRVQFRAEFFNVTNTPQFNQPNSAIESPNSGRITSAGSDATLHRTERHIQLALKILF